VGVFRMSGASKVGGKVHINKARTGQMPPGLTQLYDRIFQQVVSVNFEEMIPYALDILPAVCLVFRPITRRELAVLSGLPSETRDHPDQVEEYLELCGSFLALRKKPHSQSAILSQDRLRIRG